MADTELYPLLGPYSIFANSDDANIMASAAMQDKTCPTCRYAELWEQIAGTPDVEDLAVAPELRLVASERERIEAAKTLYTSLYRWQFRLLKLYPSSLREKTIFCDLVVANMIEPLKGSPGVGLAESGDVIEYEAISYTWGSPNFSATIRCNGVDLPVPSNAHEVLFFLRLTSQVRWVWMDSVCINQLNTEEKNWQVQQHMFGIFQRAKKIVCYLDRPSGKCTRVVQFLSALRLRGDDPKQEQSSQHNQSSAHESAEDTLQTIADSAMELILACSYFRRIWIRQEVFAAQRSRSLDLQTATHVFSWEMLEDLIHYAITSSDQDRFQAQQRFRNLRRPFEDDGRLRYGPEDISYLMGLWPALLLQNTMGFQSSLDVDRIFALYNIAEKFGALPEGAPLDYSLTFPEAYYKFISFLGRTKFGAPLFRVFEDFRDRASDLPSYMVDIRKEKPRFLRVGDINDFLLCDPVTGPDQKFRDDLNVADRWSITNKRVVPGSYGEDRRTRSQRLGPPPKQPSSLTPFCPLLMCALEIGHLGSYIDAQKWPHFLSESQIWLDFVAYAYAVPNMPSSEFEHRGPTRALRDFLSMVESLSYTWYSIYTKMAFLDIHGNALLAHDSPYVPERVVLASTVAREGDVLVAAVQPLSSTANCILLRPNSASNTSYKYLGPCLCFEKFETIFEADTKQPSGTETSPGTEILNPCRHLQDSTIAWNMMPLEYFWII